MPDNVQAQYYLVQALQMQNQQTWQLARQQQWQIQQVALEAAVLPSQIEQLPDLAGYLKLASRPEWLQVRLTPDHDYVPQDRTRGGHEL